MAEAGEITGPERWGAELYGEPCRECRFVWDLGPGDAVLLTERMPERFERALAGATGRERLPELGWDVTGYVAHVGDNLRIWAERLTGARLSGDSHAAGYDADALAEARSYDRLPLAGALWSLRWSAEMWAEALDAALDAGTVLDHSRRGTQTAADVARNNAHDAFHHLWDVERTLAAAGSATGG
jgi:hypothetical protein